MSETLATLYDRRVAEGLTDDPAQRALLPRLERIRAFVEDPPRRGWLPRFSPVPEAPKGLYLWGGVGRGKSMLMDLFHGAVRAQAKRRVHFHAFMQEVQAGLDAARKRGVSDALVPVADALAGLRLLCLDEMQITDIADAMIVGRLFERLFGAGVIVVTTSNRPPGDLYKDGLNRQLFVPFIRLIEERLEVVELAAAQDYRQGLAASETYFAPANAAAREAIDRIWEQLAGGQGDPLVLRVKGRDVVLPRHRDGVARASFWELCGRPLGPADYLSVAESVRVLILENVPRLSSENFNEARRFVTLVDALYEARRRLVVSAADIPENLYLEGEGAFEFERTASRLREMQSERWAEA